MIAMMLNPNPRVLSISELTHRIKGILSEEIGSVVVQGEISNIKRYSSGHTYFVLKDERAQLNAVLFAGARAQLNVESCLKDGQLVRAGGQISVFEGRGQYQLIVRKIEGAGIGQLLERYEQLKKKLSEDGLFDQAHKQPLPLLPGRIGVVTSPSGAVIHDMLNVLRRRFPNMNVLLAPVKVQGEGAAESIARAVRWLNESCGEGSSRQVDVIIVGRGGGSLEDLWAFNEEIVARAIYESRIPVISAVGHEVDYALSDFVADLRAPTPSAAAELVVRSRAEFESLLQQRADQMKRLLLQRCDILRHRLRRSASSPVLNHPDQAMARYAQRVDHLDMRLRHAVRRELLRVRGRYDRSCAGFNHLRERKIDDLRTRLGGYWENMRRCVQTRCLRLRDSMEHHERQLLLLNPLNILERGYSLTRTKDGLLIRSVADVKSGSVVLTMLKDGKLISEVSTVCID
jgi:exodeoxyribonuclease VII large subunit